MVLCDFFITNFKRKIMNSKNLQNRKGNWLSKHAILFILSIVMLGAIYIFR